MAPSRRRSHPAKLVLATVLLIVSVAVASAAVLLGTVPALTVSTLVGALVGVLVGVLMFAEIVVMRRVWARERVTTAVGHLAETMERHESHMAFVGDMSQRLARKNHELLESRAELARLQDTMLNTEIETALARERLSAEKARSRALQDDVESAASDLQSAHADLLKAKDALAASESAGVAARAELLAWEEASAAAEADATPGRRRLTA